MNRPMTDAALDAVTVCLYLAIPEKDQTHREIAPRPRRFKSLVKTALDRVATALSGRLHLDLYHYETASGIGGDSNQADIAIGKATNNQLTRASRPPPARFLE